MAISVHEEALQMTELRTDYWPPEPLRLLPTPSDREGAARAECTCPEFCPLDHDNE